MVSKRKGKEVEFVSIHAGWEASEEKLFIQLMVEEVKKGNKSSTTFSRKGWRNIEQEFRGKTNKRYNITQFRNKFNRLKVRYHDFNKLLKEPGVSWDPVLNTVTTAEEVWDSFLKANKDGQRFRKKGCAMFHELGFIFGDPTEKGKDIVPPFQSPLVSEDNLELEDSSTNTTPPTPPSNTIKGKDFSSQSVQICQQSATQTSHLSGDKEVRIVDDLKERTEVAKTTNPVPTKLDGTMPQSNDFSITSCVKCLESIQGVDASTYVKAIKMFKDVEWREMFMAMSAERKVVWLASLDSFN